jgi:hypothetical protein
LKQTNRNWTLDLTWQPRCSSKCLRTNRFWLSS